MRFALPVAAVLLVATSCSPPAEQLVGQDLLILQGPTVIDGIGSPPLPDGVVVIQGDRILRVGRSGQFRYPADAELIDLEGTWIVPGFIDTHAHMPDFEDQEDVLRTLLQFGITSVRSPDGERATGVALRDRLADGEILGPHLRTAGRLIDAPGGIFSGLAAEVSTVTEIRAEVKRQAEEGVDFIKLYRGISPDLAGAAIDEAHSLGLRVVGHLVNTTWGQGAELGIDGLAHFGIFGTPWELAPKSDWETIKHACVQCDDGEGLRVLRRRLSEDEARSAAWARALSGRGVSVEPNLVLLHAVFWGDDAGELQALEPFHAPATWRNTWWDEVPHPYRAPCTDEWGNEAKQTYPIFEELIVLLERSGVLLTVGTDLMNPWMTPGVSYHRELELLVAAGLTPEEVLRAATHDGAVALGTEEDVGTVEPGKLADLVVLAADPLKDIRNTRSIELVVLGGELLDAGERRPNQ